MPTNLTPEQRTYLECPCCGDDGAVSDAAGLFHDEQPLICGCPGRVDVDEDAVAAIYINDDEPCPTCDPESPQ